MEQIIVIALLATFGIMLMNKYNLFDNLQVHEKITVCLFCWAWWICLLLSLAKDGLVYQIAYLMRQPILLSVIGFQFLMQTLVAACSTVVTVYLLQNIMVWKQLR